MSGQQYLRDDWLKNNDSVQITYFFNEFTQNCYYLIESHKQTI